MDLQTKPGTFNCYDHRNERVLIYPHGPDPVLFGIRGESPGAVRRAMEMLQPIDNLAGFMIFRSNQGTGEHLRNFLDLSNVQAYSCGKIRGQVTLPPRVVEGGHVFFRMSNESGSIDCAAYEPTGAFRKDVLSMIRGDIIEVAGSIRRASKFHQRILNLEYMIPLQLVEVRQRMTTGSSTDRWRISPRTIKQREIYLPDLKAHRHLTKPRQRYDVRASDANKIVEEPKNFIFAVA
jgi:tRNA(Ile2)-agmatinylcytidine synthase